MKKKWKEHLFKPSGCKPLAWLNLWAQGAYEQPAGSTSYACVCYCFLKEKQFQNSFTRNIIQYILYIYIYNIYNIYWKNITCNTQGVIKIYNKPKYAYLVNVYFLFITKILLKAFPFG